MPIFQTIQTQLDLANKQNSWIKAAQLFASTLSTWHCSGGAGTPRTLRSGSSSQLKATALTGHQLQMQKKVACTSCLQSTPARSPSPATSVAARVALRLRELFQQRCGYGCVAEAAIGPTWPRGWGKSEQRRLLWRRRLYSRNGHVYVPLEIHTGGFFPVVGCEVRTLSKYLWQAQILCTKIFLSFNNPDFSS